MKSLTKRLRKRFTKQFGLIDGLGVRKLWRDFGNRFGSLSDQLRGLNSWFVGLSDRR
jgi:hypothetical protein